MEDPALFDPKKYEEPKPQTQPEQDIAIEPEQTVAESPEPVPEAPQAQAAPEQERLDTTNRKNFAAVRERAVLAERERDELARRLQQIEAAKNQQPADDDIQLGNDELAEGKHLNKVTKKMKQMEQELQQYKQQSAALIAETAIKTRYPDFDTVVNQDNIAALRATYPDLAASINANPDILSKASAAYVMIKQMGIVPNDTFGSDRDRAQKNAAKPRPVASVSAQGGNSPLSQANAFANGLTDEVKEQLRKEMNECRKDY